MIDEAWFIYHAAAQGVFVSVPTLVCDLSISSHLCGGLLILYGFRRSITSAMHSAACAFDSSMTWE